GAADATRRTATSSAAADARRATGAPATNAARRATSSAAVDPARWTQAGAVLARHRVGAGVVAPTAMLRVISPINAGTTAVDKAHRADARAILADSAGAALATCAAVVQIGG